jgi:hypothetical protein
MLEDSKKHAAVALGTFLDNKNNNLTKNKKRNSMTRISNGIKNIFHHSSPTKASVDHTSSSSRIVDLGTEIKDSTSPRKMGESGQQIIDSLREKLFHW